MGDYLKKPEYPIWVVGSTSHFTVLFALDPSVNEETAAEQLLTQVSRAFKQADPDENGFVLSAQLEDILRNLNMADVVGDAHQLARLRGHLQIEGEIILWSSFWESISKLLSKQATVDSLIDGAGSAAVGGANDDADSMDVLAPGAGYTGRMQRSDSDLARQLQAELDGSVVMNFTNDVAAQVASIPPAAAAAPDNNALGSTARPRSDSDYARELQRQFEVEDGEMTGGAFPPLPPPPPPPLPVVPAAANAVHAGSPLMKTNARAGMHRHDRCIYMRACPTQDPLRSPLFSLAQLRWRRRQKSRLLPVQRAGNGDSAGLVGLLQYAYSCRGQRHRPIHRDARLVHVPGVHFRLVVPRRGGGAADSLARV